MIQNLYIIHDRLTHDAVGGIFTFPADAAAIRFFGDVVAQEGTIPNKHPADCELVCVGSLSTIDSLPYLILEEHSRILVTGDAIVAMRTAAQEASNA